MDNTFSFYSCTLLDPIRELDPTEYNYRMRMYYPHEMDILLSDNGFTIMEKFGNYQRDPMDGDSDMQIYVSEQN